MLNQIDQSPNDRPQLLTVPPFYNMLTVKADLNGITVLKDGRYKKRYVGSRQYEVDINGNLTTARDLKKLTAGDRERLAKSKGARPRPSVKKPKNKVTKIQKSYSLNKPDIRARLFTMIETQPRDRRELYFWTVTFPVATNDATIYRLFNTWLTKLRQKQMLKNYLWVTERQQNGTLHYHIAIPHKMNAKVANREMRVTLTTAAKASEINYTTYAARKYNGVHISKDRKGKVINFALGKRGRRSLVGYITKYVTKNDGSFTQLAWHNSRGFSALFTGITFTYLESREVYHWRFFCHSRPAHSSEFFAFYPWIADPPSSIVGELIKLNSLISKN